MLNVMCDGMEGLTLRKAPKLEIWRVGSGGGAAIGVEERARVVRMDRRGWSEFRRMI